MTTKTLTMMAVICSCAIAMNVCVLHSVASADTHTIVLRTEAQNTAPKWFLEESGASEGFAGLCTDILQAIEGESARIRFDWEHEFVPVKRIFKHLEQGEIDLVVGYAYEPKRAEQFLYSSTPLYQVNHVLAARKNEPIEPASFQELAELGEQGKVLTVFGGATATYLKQQAGITVDDLGKTPEIVLQRLLKKRGRFFYYYDYGMRYAIKRNGLEDRVKIIAHAFQTYPHYIIYSRSLAQDLIDEIEQILHELAERGELERIYQKYSTQY
jgi:glutamate/aspartate transport system substrate-binding protein